MSLYEIVYGGSFVAPVELERLLIDEKHVQRDATGKAVALKLRSGGRLQIEQFNQIPGSPKFVEVAE